MKQRTLVLTAPYFPPHAGGLERYAFEVARTLTNNHEWRVVVITSADTDEDQKQVAHGLTIYRLRYDLKISNTPLGFSWPSKIRKILKDENPDLVNVHTPVPGLGDIAALLTKKEKLIVTYHAQSMRKGKLIPDLFVWAYEHMALPLLLRRAQKIICSSDAVRLDFLKSYARKSVTIPPAVNQELFTLPTVQKTRPTVLFVAADLSYACQYKGLSFLIGAIEILRNRGIEVELSVVGEGDMRKEYEAYAHSRDLSDRVHFKGKLAGEDLLQAYQEASIFALPTSNDSYPTVILEAMAAGLPVVSTTVGDIPTIVEDGKTGFLIVPHDKVVLAQKLEVLLLNKHIASAFGALAREKAVREFNWKERAQRYQELFNLVEQEQHPIVHCLGYYPPHVGGMEQRVQDLATKLAEQGKKVTVLTSSVGARAGVEIQNGVEVMYLRTLELFHTPLAPGLIRQLFKVPKNSIIHLHIAQAFFPEVVALVSKLRGLTYIAHIRLLLEIPSSIVGKLLLPAYSKFILGPVLRGAKKIIVLTPDYIEILHTQFQIPKEKIVVIPNATTFSRLSFSRTYVHTPIRLLAVGRISTQKNYSLMLEVAELLKKEHGLKFMLTIVGSGKDSETLKARAKAQGIDAEVLFTGDLTGETLQNIYEESDIFIHTALAESFGTVFLEAMSKGLPIVAPDVMGLRNVVKHGHNGLLAPHSAIELSSAVMRLINTPHLYRKISANNLLDVEQYDWQKITEKTVAVYREAFHLPQ